MCKCYNVGVCEYWNNCSSFTVVQAGKDTSYFLIICVGFGITAILLYYTFGELFSGNSVQSLFSVSLKRIKADEKVTDVLDKQFYFSIWEIVFKCWLAQAQAI